MNMPPPPKERPWCPRCGKPLRPVMEGGASTYDNGPRRWTGRYHSYGYFCSLKCCNLYANLVYSDFLKEREQ